MSEFAEFGLPPYKIVVSVTAGGDAPCGLSREADARFVVDTDDYPHLWFRSCSPSVGMVAHECLHLVIWAVKRRAQIPLNIHFDGWEEVIAYPLEYALTQCILCLAQLRAKKRPRTRTKK